ncbi:hypothetical protein CAL25_22945 [Bordetella genomosp. 5]|uniref:Uncharacterized protein n=1 Tax=Bordetella genomosp. 5 TaxID=1395608 RepID=A0A261T449_9BORD|nr:hypothetical protein CAL25_22945 [Bordetella genomosp. 5]
MITGDKAIYFFFCHQFASVQIQADLYRDSVLLHHVDVLSGVSARMDTLHVKQYFITFGNFDAALRLRIGRSVVCVPGKTVIFAVGQ